MYAYESYPHSCVTCLSLFEVLNSIPADFPEPTSDDVMSSTVCGSQNGPAKLNDRPYISSPGYREMFELLCTKYAPGLVQRQRIFVLD